MQEQCKRGFTSDEQEIEEASLGYEQRRDCKGEELGGGGSGSPIYGKNEIQKDPELLRVLFWTLNLYRWAP